MSLHYLDPEREPRECPNARRIDGALICNCPECHGTGRLGVEGAEPDVEVEYHPHTEEWFAWSINWEGNVPLKGLALGCGFTEADALAAARKAHRERA